MPERLITPFALYFRELLENFSAKAALSGIFGFAGTLVGGAAPLINALFVLMLLDFVLGFWRAVRLHAVSGSKLKAGALKFVFYALSVVVMAGVDFALIRAGLMRLPLRDLYIAYLCITEGLSALEHLAWFGVPVPPRIRETLLRQYRTCVCPGEPVRK